MRMVTLLVLISAVSIPCTLAFADEAHYIRFDDTPRTQNTMDYWDDGGYARGLLPSARLLNQGVENKTYSAPQEPAALPASDETATSQEQVIPHFTNSAPEISDNQKSPI